ncbi:DUF6048 family protein [Aurantibacter sp.]|uniref:DUF6048 family protein n=1 Tax=Aurantibacter sp. TaxID=2807103 RepID=UPI0035C78FCC
MKRQRILIYIISSFLLLSVSLTAQNETETTTDSISTQPRKFGVRVGTDASKLLRTALDDDYTGFELIADYRFSRKFFIAGELGNEQKEFVTDFLDITTKGTYFKIGVDYNMHDNLFPLDNMIYSGFRIGASSFSQTLNNATYYTTNQYWQTQGVANELKEYSGLTGLWAEIQMGIKAEVLTNLYVGFNAQLKYLFSQDIPENFTNVFIPGFNKVFEDSKVGVGYGYTISYRIPLYKK